MMDGIATPRRLRGFTLLELMIVISVLAILAVVAVPNFNAILLNWRVTSSVNDLMTSMRLARSESEKSGRAVVVCPGTLTTCTPSTTGWSSGWIVFVNTDNDSPPALDSGEKVLSVYAAPSNGGISVSTAATAFIFQPFGTRDTAGTLTVCDPRGAPFAKAVIVSAAGKVRSSTLNASNNPLSCP